MQPIFQSTFLQALGFAIANSVWQTALVWLICICVNNLLSISAAAKYRVAVAAQFTSFAWFMITLQFYYTQYSQAWQQSAITPSSQNIQAMFAGNAGFTSTLINWMVKAEQFLPYVSMAYLLLMLFLCIKWILGYRQTQQIRNHGLQKIPVNWRLFVKKIAAQLGIKKEIRLFLSETITTPMTIGFLKPVILIPIASINHLTTHQLEAVLLHELAHIKRYDYLVNIILSVVEISLFFNPFTQLLSKSIRKERENSCDDWVLQFQYNASAYAEALLRIAYLQSVPAFAMAATGKKNELLVRVKRMIEKKENRFNYRKQLLAFVIVTGMLSSIAWLNPIAPAHTKSGLASATQAAGKKNLPSVAIEPMAVSVDNPLFNPVFFLSAPLKAEMKKNLASAQKEIDALGLTDSKGSGDFFTSIPPMVAHAMEQASVEMAEKNKKWEKDLEKIELAKMSMENAFYFDSASLLQNFLDPFKEELAKSLQSADADIAKAKREMNRVAKIKMDINFDTEKIRRDIKKATDEINKLQLDKLVSNALGIPGKLFDFNDRPVLLNKGIPKTREMEKLKQKEQKKELPYQKIPLPVKIETVEEEVVGIYPAVLESISLSLESLSSVERIHPEIAVLMQAKIALLQEWIKKQQPKMIQAVCKEKKQVDNRMIIQLQ